MFSFFKSIRRFLKNFKWWLPVIWNDRDFDYVQIYYVLYIKFKKMEEFFESNENTFAINNKKKAKEIRVAKNLAYRLANEGHLKNALLWYYKKYGNKLMFRFVNNEESKCKKLICDDEEKRRMFSIWANHSRYMEQQDREYLFSLLNKKIEGWWD